MSHVHGNTKGHQLHIHKVHVADGFVDDCEELIHRWIRTDTLTYQTFCEIWKDMQFNFLYHGRSTGAEMAEMTEEFIHIAKHYMVSNTDNYEESIAGLFLVYGLLHLQPYERFVSVRLVPEDVPAITRLEAYARRNKRYDVLYILGSVLIEGPVQYHAADRERGMESSIRKYLEGTTGIDRLGVRPKGVFFRQNEELDLLRELNSITRRYTDAKKHLGEENSRGLNYTNDKLITKLDSSLKELINGIVEDGEAGNKKITEHLSSVQAIKERAMRQGVDSVKHLASVAERTASRSKSNTCELKEKSGKIQQGSPRKLAALKRQHSGRSSKPKRRRASTSCSDSEESDSSDFDPDEMYQMQTSTADINLEEFHQAPAENENKNVQIEIDSLPVLIRTEQDGKCIEIEIVDEMNETESEASQLNAEKESDPGDGISQGSDNDGAVLTEGADKHPKLVKKERREQKKTLLKSKFKRMGMLPVANFEEASGKSPSNENKDSEK